MSNTFTDSLCMFGPNGSGKSTMLRLALKLLFPKHAWISTGEGCRRAKAGDEKFLFYLKKQLDSQADLKRFVQKNIVDPMAAGQLVADMHIDLILQALMAEHVDNGGGPVGLDGYPRSLPQEQLLANKYLITRRISGLLVLEFTMDHKICETERLVKQATEQSRSDNSPEARAKRLEEYRKKTMPVLNAFRLLQREVHLHVQVLPAIDASRHPELVFADICKLLKVENPGIPPELLPKGVAPLREHAAA